VGESREVLDFHFLVTHCVILGVLLRKNKKLLGRSWGAALIHRCRTAIILAVCRDVSTFALLVAAEPAPEGVCSLSITLFERACLEESGSIRKLVDDRGEVAAVALIAIVALSSANTNLRRRRCSLRRRRCSLSLVLARLAETLTDTLPSTPEQLLQI
jgi:hypothetical protein